MWKNVRGAAALLRRRPPSLPSCSPWRRVRVGLSSVLTRTRRVVASNFALGVFLGRFFYGIRRALLLALVGVVRTALLLALFPNGRLVSTLVERTRILTIRTCGSRRGNRRRSGGVGGVGRSRLLLGATGRTVGTLPLALWPPPKIDGRVLVLDPPPPSTEDSSVEHSLHNQQDKLFPTRASTPVMAISPTTNEITAATRLPNRIERRFSGESGRVGKDKTLDNSALDLPRMPRR